MTFIKGIKGMRDALKKLSWRMREVRIWGKGGRC